MKTIVLSAPANRFAEGDMNVSVSHTAVSSQDARYSELSEGEVAKLQGQVLDDDAAGIVLARLDAALTTGLPLLGTDLPVAVGPAARRITGYTVPDINGL